MPRLGTALLSSKSTELFAHAQACCQSAQQPAAVVGKDGRLSAMNAKMIDLLGCKGVKWLHQPFERFFAHQSDGIATGSGVLALERANLDWLVRRSGGLQLPVALHSVAIGEVDQRIYLVTVHEDCDEVSKRRKALEGCLNMGRMTRKVAVGTLVADLAHEMNQPLTAITLYATACSRQEALDKPMYLLRPMLGQLRDQSALAFACGSKLAQAGETAIGSKPLYE